MKKLLSLILVAVLCLGVLTSCDAVETVKGGFNTAVETVKGGFNTAVNTVKGWLGMEVEPDEPAIEYHLDKAVEYVNTLYRGEATLTTGDYELVARVQVKGVMYTVDWAVDNELVKATKGEKTWTIDVPEKAEADINYKLTATVTAGDGTKATVSFDRTVPAYKEMSYAEFLATKDGDPVVIKGVLTGIVETSKENDLYLQDENGGYFVYALAKLPSELGLKIGMTVQVSGLRDTYYSVPQITNASVDIVSSDITPAAPVDITSVFTNAENVDFKNFEAYANMLVTIKGARVLGQDTENNSYYNFSLAGKTSYVRISSSTSMLSAEADAAFKKNVADHTNDNADVTGIVVSYNNKMYLVPVDANAFSNFVAVQLSDEEMVDFELGHINVENVTEDGVISIPVVGSKYNTVALSWESDNTCAVVDNTAGTLTVTRGDSENTVNLTLTATLGSVTKTKTITIKVAGKVFDGTANLTADNMGLGDYAEGSVTVEGFEFGYTELGSYGNGIQMRIKNGNTATLWNNTKFSAGIARIVLVFNSAKDTYNNANAFKFSFGDDSTVASYSVNLDTVAGTKTYTIIPDKDTYTYFKMELLLTYTFYWDEINIVLTSDPSIQNHTCDYTYKAATCIAPATCECGKTQGAADPTAHDYAAATCTLPETCKLCKQAKEGSVALGHSYADANCVAPATCKCGEVKEGSVALGHTMTDTGCSTCNAKLVTVSDLANEAKGTLVIFTGVVSSIKTAWNSQYKNMDIYVVDETGTSFYVYRIGTQVKVGDIVTITGKTDEYKGTKQIGQGSTGVIKGTHEHTWGTDDKCYCGADKPASNAITVTAAYASGAGTTNMADGNNAATLGLNADLFTVTADKGSASNNVGLNNAGDFRLYWHAEGSNKLTFDMADGYTIQSVVITFTGTSNGKSCQVSANGSIITTTSADGVASVEVAINANSFELYNAHTSSTQVRISSIVITYSAPATTPAA